MSLLQKIPFVIISLVLMILSEFSLDMTSKCVLSSLRHSAIALYMSFSFSWRVPWSCWLHCMCCHRQTILGASFYHLSKSHYHNHFVIRSTVIIGDIFPEMFSHRWFRPLSLWPMLPCLVGPTTHCLAPWGTTLVLSSSTNGFSLLAWVLVGCWWLRSRNQD